MGIAVLFELLTVVTFVTVHSFGMSPSWFPADDLAELSFVNGIDSNVKLLGQDVFGLFRPIKNLLFFLFSQLPPDVRFCRLISILVGVGSFFCICSLFRRIFSHPWQSALASAVWLLSPTQVSSVAWLSCVNIQLMCAFAALAVVCHDRESLRWRLAAAGWLFLALVSYENAVVVGPVIFGFDLLLRPCRLRMRSFWMAYGGYAAITLLYLLLRCLIGSGTSVAGSFDGVSRLEMCAASAYFTIWHFLTWLWPFGRFAVFGGYCHGDVLAWTLAACWLLIVAMVVVAWLCWKRRPVCAFGIAVALIGFLPVSNLAGLGNGPYGDYYLGVSSIGLSAVLVELVAVGLSGRGMARIAGGVLAAVVVGLRTVGIPEAAHWARLWGDGTLAYEESVRNFPGVFSNWLKLAQLRCNAGDYRSALIACEAAEARLGEVSPQRMEACQVRAIIALNEEKSADRALAFNEKAKAVARPGVYEAFYHQFRGCVFEDLKGDVKAAKEEYRQSLAIRFDMDSLDSANRLARLEAIDGNIKDAIALWERALAIRPDDALVRHNLETARRQR